MPPGYISCVSILLAQHGIPGYENRIKSPFHRAPWLSLSFVVFTTTHTSAGWIGELMLPKTPKNALEKPDVYGTDMAPSSFRCMFRFIHKFHPQNITKLRVGVLMFTYLNVPPWGGSWSWTPRIDSRGPMLYRDKRWTDRHRFSMASGPPAFPFFLGKVHVDPTWWSGVKHRSRMLQGKRWFCVKNHHKCSVFSGYPWLVVEAHASFWHAYLQLHWHMPGILTGWHLPRCA